MPPSNPPIRHKLPQHRVDARLPARTAAAQMFYGAGVEPDLHFDLWSFQLGTPAPGRLHPGQKGGIERRIVVVDSRVKFGDGKTSFHAFQSLPRTYPKPVANLNVRLHYGSEPEAVSWP